MRAGTAHLDLPFFDITHREIGNCLADWLPKQHIDEQDDRAACKQWVKHLGVNQWLRYCVPAAHGGALPQLDSRALVVLRENLAFHSALADFAFAMQGLGSGAITLAGSAQLQAQYLPAVARGEKIAAFALSEPDAGSDVSAIKTIANYVPSTGTTGQNTYQITGTKTWISNGGIADFYVVFAKTAPALGTRGISAFLVDASTPGLDASEHIAVMAPHPLATLRFDHCPVPTTHLLGAENSGFKLAMQTLDIFRASVAAAALGFARRALAEAVHFAQQRQMFGHSLAHFQLTQAKLGDMVALIDAGALLTYRAAWMRDVALPAGTASREQYTAAAAAAKMTATENASRVIDMAVQMHGGLGVKVGSRVERLYRDIRALRIYEGATEVQQLILGKSVLKGVP
ncbi:MAG: acyl-CoA dehydrogenase family protein [Burkholderiaceae bacterium]